MFGVTHVIAVDGYSYRVVGHATMPVKNNLTIYEEVYRLVGETPVIRNHCVV